MSTEKWRIEKRPDDPYSKNFREPWWVSPPGGDAPEETWHRWSDAMWWVDRQTSR